MRRQRLLGAAIVLACTALTTGVGAAARAEPTEPTDPSIVFSIPTDVALPIGGATRTVEAHSTTANVEGPEVVFHIEDLAGVATIEFPDDCVTSGDSNERVTCPLPESGEHPFPLLVTPAATGTAGDTGKLHMSVQATDYGPYIVPDVTFTLGDGVDLAIAEFPDGGTVQPEQPLQVPAPQVTNVGNKATAGIRVKFGFGDPTLVPRQYEDCTYTDTDATCDVPLVEPLEPGEGVTLWPFDFTTTADALGKKGVWVTVEALDEADAAAALSKAPAKTATGVRWAGDAAARSVQQASAAAQEVNPDDNGAEFVFEVENTYDIEALGATATGAVGAEVKVTIGARNHGPGTLDATRGQEFAWWFYFAVPPGTEVVGVPDRCAGKVVDGDSSEYVPGRAGVTLYQCHHEAFRFPVDTSTTVEFTLKITEVIADAKGEVSWTEPDATPPPADANTANDKADVVINATAGGGGGGGNNDGLPITGTNTAALAGVGLGLVLVGSVLYFVSTRRRPGPAA